MARPTTTGKFSIEEKAGLYGWRKGVFWQWRNVNPNRKKRNRARDIGWIGEQILQRKKELENVETSTLRKKYENAEYLEKRAIEEVLVDRGIEIDV